MDQYAISKRKFNYQQTFTLDEFRHRRYSLCDAVDPASLTYKADAGTRWAYHNVYVKLQDVIAKASGQIWPDYFNTKLRDKIGMSGSWIQIDNNSVYLSTTRSMARFGLLMLNKGK